MGVYSTVSITREDAIEEIKKGLLDFSKLTDEQIDNILFTIYAEKNYFNYWIVKEYDPTDEMNYPNQKENFLAYDFEKEDDK